MPSQPQKSVITDLKAQLKSADGPQIPPTDLTVKTRPVIVPSKTVRGWGE